MKSRKTLPLSQRDIERAAEEMIKKHGEHAYAEASKEISIQVSNGFYSLAGSWQLIREEILNRQPAQIIRDATKDDVTLSE